MKKSILIISAGFMALFSACQPDDPTPTGQKGTVKVHFDNRVDQQDLELNSGVYTNANGDDYQVTALKYYISNIRLNSAEDTFAQEESYFLINEADPTSQVVQIPDIPAGTYNSITLLMGVDSKRNTSGAQTGALDPIHGMFWTWNTGYIMAKFEGTSTSSSAPNQTVTIHLGGFIGPHSVLRTVTLDFPSPVTLDGNTFNIHVNANLNQWFSNPNTIDFATTNNLMLPGEPASQVADNYATMLSITSVEPE